MHNSCYRCLPNYVLQALVNKSINMVKQLYYSKMYSKNIKIYLSKLLYIGMYYEVNDVIKYTAKHLHLLIVLSEGVLLIMSCVKTAVHVT